MLRAAALATGGLATWAGAEAARLSADRAGRSRWLARDLNPIDRAGRRWIRWPRSTRAADLASDLLAYLVVPTACAWALLRPGESLVAMLRRDALPMTEATTVTGLANQLIKHIAMRERPFAAGRSKHHAMADRYGSFFSGHTASAAVVCAGTAVRRLGEARWSYCMLSIAALPVAVGYLRVAADKHYLTDVVAGLGAGAAIGALHAAYIGAQEGRTLRRPSPDQPRSSA